MSKTSYKTLHQRAHFLNVLRRDLERISGQLDPSRVVRYALRRTGEMLQAVLVFQVDVERSDGSLGRPYFLSLARAKRGPTGTPSAESTSSAASDQCLETCRAFLQRPLGPAEPDLLLLRVTVEDRPVAVLGFRRPGRAFSRAETRFGQDAAEIVSENLLHRERERAQAVKQRIYAKILSEIRPQDVLYQILHGLKRLLQYDHGAAVMLLEHDGSLSLQAEIVAWAKAKSERIGQRTPVTPELERWLEKTTHPVLLRAGDPEGSAFVPPCLLEPMQRVDPPAPPVRAMFVAVLRHRERALGCLQIRSTHAAAFTRSDVQTLDQFLPLATVTLYNSSLYKTQHDLLVTAERKTALADLARAISHDLNNSFGVILPLLQTMRRDLADGSVSPEQTARDLEVIEHYSASSARIFQGLLSVAQGVAEEARWSDLNAILEAILRMMGSNLESRHIQIERHLDPALPRVYLRRGEMEQLFLNLIYNARDAMPGGGSLTIRTKGGDGGVTCVLADTGIGIPEQIKNRIFEPFFTTKETGSGLGLDICRSIIWDYDGRFHIDSTPGVGTQVSVWLPLLAERLREEAEAGAPGAPLPPVGAGVRSPDGEIPHE